ncbi:YncE family protein [Streptomyces sp. MBT53]|uniref:YncE family protein n=1 Tax=Streptomyces sp. MBT53 TaxID=1488384 RepID=UPI001911D7A2|nr:hypothetical protein [Streptomyces sp. MBT53]MBK6014476.1 hypothetical protein [Streptomyces sp. MBT53]
MSGASFAAKATVSRLPAAVGPVADLAPVSGAPRSQWLLLTTAGDLVRFDADSGTARTVGATTVPAEPQPDYWREHVVRRRLHASHDGRFAGIVNDYGRYGEVADLETGRVTLSLDGGDYHQYTVPFSFAFTQHKGRTLVVHRTAWNRLDVSDALTGELLTPRDPGIPHRLDYFHGALAVSPRGTRIADDGWIWQPYGVPTVLNLRSWIEGRTFESEDGRTRKELDWRDYYWNEPQCWIDERHIAVTGLKGIDYEAKSSTRGVRVFDAVRCRELLALPGVEGALFAADGMLFAAALAGLQAWDPVSGELRGTVPGFVPTHHHPGAAELVAFDGETLSRLPLSCLV